MVVVDSGDGYVIASESGDAYVTTTPFTPTQVGVQLQLERDTYAWLYTELMYKLTKAALEQAMNKPETKEQMLQALMAKMGQR